MQVGELRWFDSTQEIPGQHRVVFVMGPGFLLEWTHVEAGSISFFRGGEQVRPAASCFGILYAPFSITELCFENCRASWVGVASSDPSVKAPFEGPVIFELDSHEKPGDPQALLRCAARAVSTRRIDRAPTPSPLSVRLKSSLDESYRQNVPIARIAESFGVSHEHLSRQFKKDYGLAPVAYRHRLRANEAIARLTRGERIADVAYEVGYNDLGRFYQGFRKATRASPGSCRVQVRQDRTRS